MSIHNILVVSHFLLFFRYFAFIILHVIIRKKVAYTLALLPQYSGTGIFC